MAKTKRKSCRSLSRGGCYRRKGDCHMSRTGKCTRGASKSSGAGKKNQRKPCAQLSKTGCYRRKATGCYVTKKGTCSQKRKRASRAKKSGGKQAAAAPIYTGDRAW